VIGDGLCLLGLVVEIGVFGEFFFDDEVRLILGKPYEHAGPKLRVHDVDGFSPFEAGALEIGLREGSLMGEAICLQELLRL
jgi:hypothetical protein